MHEAFNNAGWLNGLINMIIIGFICTYCFHVLVRSQYILCKKHRRALLSYPESMKLALEQGPKGLRWIAPSATLITDGFLIIYQLGVCICYIVFVAKNLEQVSFNYSCQLISIKNAVLDSCNLRLCMGCETCDVGNVHPSFGYELSQESQSFSTILDVR